MIAQRCSVHLPARLLAALAVALALLPLPALVSGSAAASEPPSVVYFPVTGHHVAEPFLSTWRQLGGLATFGYPLTEAFIDPASGFSVQYFERERFEYHPENAGTEWEVLFGLLGSWKAHGNTDPAFTPLPADQPPPPDPGSQRFFPETGHWLSFGFKHYWETHGGLRIFGYPISEEFTEDDRTVQYFERARFEWHPENAGTVYEVLLGRLGADVAAAEGLDTGAVPRLDGVPDYDESLFAPPPAEPRSLDISVLMYHRIGENVSRYEIPCWRFAQQLDWLAANGYHTVTLTQLYDAVAGSGDLPANPVVLSFDDGFGSQQCAVDALNARGMVGVFFITTSQNGLDLATMARQGHEIGSHTLHHANLPALSDAQLWDELAGSRATLQAWSGAPVDILAYPYGAYDSRVIATAQAAGYRAAVAAWGGSWWTPEKWWAEPRIEVAGYLTLAEFAGLVR